MGIADIIKKRQRKRKLDKEFLYGVWSKDMDEDDIERSGYAPLEKRAKTGSEGYRNMSGESLVEEGKKKKKNKKRADSPYKGWKSDVAWLKKHGKARVSGGKK